MSKWKNVRTYLEVNPYTGQPVEEDMPTNAVLDEVQLLVSVLAQMESQGLTQRKRKRKL